MRIWFLRIVLVLQVLGLVGLYAYYAYNEQAGKTYLLKVEPVDPRDLLSGDYVSLRYTISALPDALPDVGTDSGEVVFVALRPKGSVWEIGEVDQTPPTGDVPYLKGCAYGRWIQYGIERYYVPEGKGKNIPGDLQAEIVIQPGGIAQLRKLYSDGKPWPK